MYGIGSILIVTMICAPAPPPPPPPPPPESPLNIAMVIIRLRLCLHRIYSVIYYGGTVGRSPTFVEGRVSCLYLDLGLIPNPIRVCGRGGGAAPG